MKRILLIIVVITTLVPGINQTYGQNWKADLKVISEFYIQQTEVNVSMIIDLYHDGELIDPEPDPKRYNAAHWNGSEWKLKRITVEFRGNFITPPLEGIYAFSSDDIWMVGSLPIHGDGENWIMYDLRTTVDPNLSLSKAWGSSSNDMNFVGRAGSIAHYSGSSGGWQKIESGTSAAIGNLYGTTSSEVYKILAVASSTGDTRVLTLNSIKASDTLDWSVDRRLRGIWFNNREVYVSGTGVWRNRNNIWEKMEGLPEHFYTGIRGSQVNNIFAVGWTVNLAHYNGINWKTIDEIPEEFNFESVAVKAEIVIAIGFTSSGGVAGQAAITMGTLIK